MDALTGDGHEQLRVAKLTIEYSSGGYAVRPIDGLDLDVATGSLVLLLGASGCGKTTLLSSMAAILKPTRGTITLGNTDVTALQGRELSDFRLRKVGVVFQSFNLLPSLTALENVTVPMRLAGLPAESEDACQAPPRVRRPRRPHRAQTERHVRWSTTASRDRTCARHGTKPRTGRRTDRAP